MIEVKGISKSLKKQMVLKNISYTFEKGSIYGVRGINGAGKTMLLRAIAGLIKLDTGTIAIDGKYLNKDIDFPESIGILIENNNLLEEYSGMKNLQLLSKIKKKASQEDIKEIILEVGLDPDDTKIVRKYSLGMKQRLAIAQAFFETPDIVLLDEPTNAIDEEGMSLVKKIMVKAKERGATIIVTSHNYIELKDISDQIITMKEGEIIIDE